jgi:hypothetical protein
VNGLGWLAVCCAVWLGVWWVADHRARKRHEQLFGEEWTPWCRCGTHRLGWGLEASIDRGIRHSRQACTPTGQGAP